jgi:tetratricopeptide (TPR) repeat protein
MSGCTDPHFRDMRHAYELGMLTDSDREKFEMHLMECKSCFDHIKQMSEAARIMRQSEKIRKSFEQLEPEEKTFSSRKKRFWPTFIPVSVVTIVILVFLILKDWEIEIHPSREAIAAENRVAVMYFANLSDPDDSLRLGEIATNLLITDLAESYYLQVISGQRIYDIMNSLDISRPGLKDLEAAFRVAEKANARWMLMGNILQMKPHPVITSQLIDVSGGDVLASQKIVGDRADDIFSMIDKLTVKIKTDLALPHDALLEEDRMISEVTTHSPEAYRYYVEGLDYYDKFYWHEAGMNFEKAIEADSTFAMAYYYLAAIKDMRLLEKAVLYSEKASRKEQHYIKSLKAWSEGDSEKAFAELREIIRYYPDEKRARYLLGEYSNALGRNDEALEYLEHVIELDPDYKLSYNLLAYVYNALGDLDKSILAIDKYISLAADEPNPYDTKADIYAVNGDLEKAIQAYRKALQIRPAFQSALTKLGFMYMFQGQYSSADSILQLLAGDSSWLVRSGARLYRTYIPLHQGRLKHCLALLDTVIKADSLNEIKLGSPGEQMSSRYLKALIYQERHEFEAAMKEIDRLRELQRTYKQSEVNSSSLDVQLLAQAGDLNRAREELQNLKRYLEDNKMDMYDYLCTAAALELIKGDFDSSVALFDQAQPPATDFLNNYLHSRACLEAGMLSRAVKKYRALIDNYFSGRSFVAFWGVKARFYLGLAYERSTWYDQAAEQYESFLNILKDADPEIEEIANAKQHLSKIRSQLNQKS